MRGSGGKPPEKFQGGGSVAVRGGSVAVRAPPIRYVWAAGWFPSQNVNAGCTLQPAAKNKIAERTSSPPMVYTWSTHQGMVLLVAVVVVAVAVAVARGGVWFHTNMLHIHIHHFLHTILPPQAPQTND